MSSVNLDSAEHSGRLILKVYFAPNRIAVFGLVVVILLGHSNNQARPLRGRFPSQIYVNAIRFDFAGAASEAAQAFAGNLFHGQF